MNIFKNKRGSALMQVLIMGSIIASVVILILRFSVTRTTNMIKTTRKISAKMYAEACYNQIVLDATVRELYGLMPSFYSSSSGASGDEPTYTYTCNFRMGNKAWSSGTLKQSTFTLQELAGGVDEYNNSLAPTVYKVTMDITNTDELK